MKTDKPQNIPHLKRQLTSAWREIDKLQKQIHRYAESSKGTTEKLEQLELQLKECHREYSNCIKHSLNSIAVMRLIRNKNGTVTDAVYLKVNKAFERIIGKKARDIVGKRYIRLFPGDENALLLDSYQKAIDTKKPITIELYSKIAHCYYKTTIYKIDDDKIGVVSEAAAREGQAGQPSANSLQNFLGLYENIQDGVARLDLKGRIMEFNPAFARMLDYSDDELKNKTIWELTHEKWHIQQEEITKLLIDTGQSGIYEKEYIRRDGSLIPVTVNAILIRDSSGNPSGIWSTIRDITQWKKSEAELKDTQRKFEMAVQATKTALFTMGSDLRYTWIYNPQLYDTSKVIGYTAEDHQGPERGRPIMDLYRKALETGTLERQIFELLGEKGEDRIFDIMAEPLRDADGRTTGLLGAAIEITDLYSTKIALEKSLAELKDSRQRFEMAVEGAQLASWEWDCRSRDANINERWASMLGYTLEDVRPVVDTWEKHIHPQDKERVLSALWDMIEGRTGDFDIEYRLSTRDGRQIWMHSKGRAIGRLPNGHAIRIAGINRDITDHMKVEEGLKESELRFRSLFENMITGFVLFEMIYDEHGNVIDARYVEINPEFERLTGLNKQQILGKTLLEQFQIADSEWLKKYGEIAKSGKSVRAERYRHETDTYFDSIMYSPQTGYVAVIFHDITERKRAEVALKESEQRFKVAVSTANMVIFTMDRHLKYTWMYNAHHGFSPEQVLGKRDDELFEPLSASAMMSIKRRVLETGVPAREEVEINFGIDSAIYDLIVEPTINENNQVTGIVCSTTDITDRKKLETIIWRTNELLETMFSSVDVQIAYLDRNLNFIRVNRAYAQTNKKNADYFAGKNHFELFPNDENERIFRGVIETGKPYYAYAKTFEHPELGISLWDWSLQPVKDIDGTVGGLVLSLIDVTTREMAFMELENKIDEIKKINAELQTFAYVASHDLQEPLRMISSYLQLLERRYRDRLGQDANEFISFAVDGAKRLQHLINSLLEYSRIESQGKPFGPVSAETALHDALTNLQVAIQESGLLIIKDELPSVIGDASQLSRLFQNLVSNSIKFRRAEEKPQIHITARLIDGFWTFSFKDNGIGIDPAYFEKIFAIFQRLHGHEYPGTGIGLSVAKRIVERHGGKIWLDSTPGLGTTFYFTLPAYDVNHNTA
jgi:PAS domain S-box-containing protein